MNHKYESIQWSIIVYGCGHNVSTEWQPIFGHYQGLINVLPLFLKHGGIFLLKSVPKFSSFANDKEIRRIFSSFSNWFPWLYNNAVAPSPCGISMFVMNLILFCPSNFTLKFYSSNNSLIKSSSLWFIIPLRSFNHAFWMYMWWWAHIISKINLGFDIFFFEFTIISSHNSLNF